MRLSQREQKICDLIASRASALLDDLRLHVATPTGMDNQPGLDETRERFTSRMSALGASVEMIDGDPKPEWLPGASASSHVPPTAICRRTNNRPGEPILIAGHLDTVHDPDGDFRSLTIAPDGKTATGPGCVDMKGGLVIAVAALEAIEEAGVGVAWTFLMNSDEETGTYRSERALRAEAKLHTHGLALEPALAGGELAIERVGSGQFMIEVTGRSAHVGREFEAGVSAVTKLAECLVAVSKMPDPASGRILSVGPLEGGVATNAVPDLARAWGNVRFPTEAAANEMAEQLANLETPDGAMPGVTILRSFNRPAKPLIPKTEALGLAARRVAEDLGQQLPFAATGGVCDGNIMQDAGLPTIDTLGVRGGKLHTTDEWIDLTSLVERCQLLAVLIARLSERGTEQ